MEEAFMDLSTLRNEIDRIDSQLVQLYEQRMEICSQVAEYKIENGKKVFDKTREEEKLARVRSLTHNDFNSQGVTELFEQIMAMSRKLQYQMLESHGRTSRLPFIPVENLDTKKARVVFQGAEGAYSQAAMMRFFGERIDSIHVDSFRDAMSAIEEGSAEFAVLPIENSTAGAVNEIYDLLVEFENYIVGETIIPIKNTLSGLPGTDISEIERVYSKAEALMQASHFLGDHGDWQQISVANTAVAAKKVLEDQDQRKAAICSEYAARLYGLEILEEKINHNDNNSTRFIIVTNQKIFLKDASKISICFEVSHESGTLYHLLSHFIYNNLSMTKIESRPVEGRTWEYRFFVDFEGNMADGAVKNAIRGLREESKSLKILGNYSSKEGV